MLGTIAKSAFKDAWISLMSQDFPAHRALDCPPFDRRLRADEYQLVRDEALRLGLENGLVPGDVPNRLVRCPAVGKNAFMIFLSPPYQGGDKKQTIISDSI